MMRRAVMLTACVVLRALTAVAVAWGFKVYYCFFTPWMNRSGLFSEEERLYEVSWSRTVGRTSFMVSLDELTIDYVKELTSLNHMKEWIGATRIEKALDADPDFAQTVERVERKRAVLESWFPDKRVPAPPPWAARPEVDSGLKAISTGAYGWPARCMAGEVHIPPMGPAVMAWNWQLTVWRPAGGQMALAMPLRPLPLGMAINTTVLAALWAGVLMGVPALRRRHRTRRGLCPACRYPAGVSNVCTECGQPVHPRAKAQP